jgi:hypothetical protein
VVDTDFDQKMRQRFHKNNNVPETIQLARHLWLKQALARD